MFLNIDLDIVGRAAEIAPLVAYFEERLTVMYVGMRRGSTTGHYELPRDVRSVDRTLAGWLRLLEALPRAARRAWDAARHKELNIGVEAEAAPSVLAVAPEQLARVVALGARLGVTVYPPSERASRTGSSSCRRQGGSSPSKEWS